MSRLFVGQNLHNNIGAWEKLIDDLGAFEHVLEWVRNGVKLPFDVQPESFEFLNTKTYTKKETLFIDKELQKLIDAKCITRSEIKPLCVSPISTVPKQGGDFRLITDLRHLNQFCVSKPFIYEDIRQVLDIAKPKDQIITCDIKNGFFHVRIHKDFTKYLGFRWRNIYYEWLVLPFGLKLSPFFFGKTLRPVVQWLRNKQKLKTVCYVDDFILLDSVDSIETSKNVLLSLLNKLGFIVNFDKSQITPSTTAKYIGYIIDTNREEGKVWLKIPNTRVNKLKHDIRRTLKKRQISARGLAKIAGQCISMSKAIIPAKLLLRNIYRLLSSKTSWQDILSLDSPSIRDLQWWLDAVSAWNGRSFEQKTKEVIQIATDASSMGWGGTIISSHWEAQGTWDPQTSSKSSNYRELSAVYLTLRSFLPLIRGKTVTIFSDNITTVANINLHGSSHKDLTDIATKIWSLVIRNSMSLQAKFLAGKSNCHADRLSRLPQQYEWILHPLLYAFLDDQYGPHTIDRFASMNTAQCERYNSLYLDPYTSGVDALEQTDWCQHNNFVNPPFRLLQRVLNLIISTKAQATVIAPWWPAMPWFQTIRAIAVCPPLKLPSPKLMCFPILAETPEPLKNHSWRMFAWRVDGNLV